MNDHLSAMTVDELEAYVSDIAARRSSLADEQREAQHILGAKLKQARLREDLEKLSAKHGVAISPDAIASAETVSEPAV